MRAAEEAAFKEGVSEDALMEIAGSGLANSVSHFFPTPGKFIVFFGKGNNGGDVLVAARVLAQRGWHIELNPVFPQNLWAPLVQLNASRLQEVTQNLPPPLPSPCQIVVADGLLGTGAKGAATGPLATAIYQINQLRQNLGAFVVAADVPSGLNPDSGECPGPCVIADLTVTFGAPKAGLLADNATNFVGRLELVKLPHVFPQSADQWTISTPELVRRVIQPRPYNLHKGKCGKIAIVAGSPRFPGAARLASSAAVKAGGGLVTLWTPATILPSLSAACSPEVILMPFNRPREVMEFQADVIAIGPGLSSAWNLDILSIVSESYVPVVADADAINALAARPGVLRKCTSPRLITPHPGEMERLFPRNGRSRRAWALDFTAAFPNVSLLLKGARSIAIRHNRPGIYNSTGHPGMATGGMGDVLTGVVAALLGQYPMADNVDILASAAWICGRAAEIAIFEDSASPESLSASDVINHLGRAFEDVRRHWNNQTHEQKPTSPPVKNEQINPAPPPQIPQPA